ncbi:MAG: alpha/beta hydrolase-fold protein [Brevefilum sp.]|nr:alpha/beta hydrolase-fold protein [Brevefilum sp.]
MLNILARDFSQQSRIETFTIAIPQLGDRLRNIQVYLPPDYDSSEKSYPVFYLFDGANLFNPLPGAVGDYAVDETLDRLFIEDSLGGVIVVGIEHNNDSEWSEYMPWVNENMYDWVKRNNSASGEGGEGFVFTDFLVQTLKPEIDSRYRTLTDKENTAIGGFCRMGLLPVVAAIKYPDTFGHVMAMSPAVWMAEEGGYWLSNNNLINFINTNSLPENVKFYIDIGTEESSGSRPPVKDQNGDRITYPRAYVEGAQALAFALKNGGVPDKNLIFQIFDGVSGKRDVWAQRLDNVFLWFFDGVEAYSGSTPVETVVPESPEGDQENQVFLPGIQQNAPSDELNNETPVETTSPRISSKLVIGAGLVLVSFAGGYWLLKKAR